jgi:hypothetical protein
MAHWQSNFDRRRINGPEESFPPVYEDDDDEEGQDAKRWKLGQPRVGRGPRDIRPICKEMLEILALSCWSIMLIIICLS